MPEEHTGQLGFEYAWKELLLRARQSGMTQNHTWPFFSPLHLDL